MRRDTTRCDATWRNATRRDAMQLDDYLCIIYIVNWQNAWWIDSSLRNKLNQKSQVAIISREQGAYTPGEWIEATSPPPLPSHALQLYAHKISVHPGIGRPFAEPLDERRPLAASSVTLAPWPIAGERRGAVIGLERSSSISASCWIRTRRKHRSW